MLPTPFRWRDFWDKAAKERIPLMESRKELRAGVPRVLNIYT